MAIQVFSATHNGQGNPLPFSEKQFISFSYGGKNIEDFNLIACFESDRLEKTIYSSFNDIVTSQIGLDGQLYWGTYYSPLELNFFLATDGMSVEDLENFKKFFVPGVEKELIVSEYPNRDIMARVSSALEISLLPFEKKEEIIIGGRKYSNILSSEYKGDIRLNFICDNPFWYSKKAYFLYEKLEKNDNIKILYEDNIPSVSMFKVESFLADNKEIISSEGTYLVQEQTGKALQANQTYNIYYCGSNVEKPEFSFNFVPSINSDNKIIFPSNSSSYLKIENDYFYYGLPEVLYCYNKAIEISNSYEIQDSIFDLKNEIRDNITHYYCRAWCVAIIEGFLSDTNRTYCDINGVIKDGCITKFKQLLSLFLKQNNESNFNSFQVSFNSKNGSSRIRYQCRKSTKKILTDNDALSSQFIDLEENSGNMAKSNYLFLREAKSFKNNNNNEITNSECLKLISSHNLTNFKISYNYIY